MEGKIFKFEKRIDHKEVIQSIYEEGKLTSEFLLYIIIAAGIGVLGFLANSSPVIIASMFISPLMSPVVLFAFSCAIVDAQKMIESIQCFLTGVVLILLVSYLIVNMSPVANITEEIIARTNPNLFDLIIAILSGIGSAYGYIRRKSLAASNVALATALLTPLIVFGFGLAVLNFDIMKGSAFLFLTNFIAVIISMFLVCKIYNFKRSGEKQLKIWQGISILTVLIILSIPLTISLKNIAYQSYIVNIVKNAIANYFEKEIHYLNKFSISFHKDHIHAESVISVKFYDPKAEEIIEQVLEDKIKQRVYLKIVQVALAPEKKENMNNELLPNKIITEDSTSLLEHKKEM